MPFFKCCFSALFFFILGLMTINAQDSKTALKQDSMIYLENPSFEDSPRHSKPPRKWFDCGNPQESPPDVQPNGGFGVRKRAINGKTYLGLVVRDNDTHEAVGQKLSTPLKQGQCYLFSLALCQSKQYTSLSRTTEEVVFYNTPVIVRIWGSKEACGDHQLLATSPPIDHDKWRDYEFTLSPTDDYDYLIIEAFFKPLYAAPYNGNLLVDYASPILLVPCEEIETHHGLSRMVSEQNSKGRK